MIVGSVTVQSLSVALVHKCTTSMGVDVVLSTTGAGGDVHFGNADVNATTNFGFHMANSVDALTVSLPFGEALYATTSVATPVVLKFAVIGKAT